MDLFEQTSNPKGPQSAPLAFRLRPQKFDDFFGQEQLINETILPLMQAATLPSLILWGPPGTGKTTLAGLIAKEKNYRFESLSAVQAGIKEVKEIIEAARQTLNYHNKKTLLFLDEIHRFNKAQQDFLLPHVESGLITLIGATTENPSFEINNALLSRAQVLVLKNLDEEALKKIVRRALTSKEGLGEDQLLIDDATLEKLISMGHGDARYTLGLLETAALFAKKDQSPGIDSSHIEKSCSSRMLNYDKTGEEHYNTISAFIKSLRGSDPDGALYYLARMIEAGEAALFIARRLVIFASEDIGNADPQAIVVAMACMQSVDFIGMPEGYIPLAQATSYLASTCKSNASYAAYKEALQDVKLHGPLEVPLHIRNAPTQLMKNMGYGKNYDYAHNNKDHLTSQSHLPDKIKNKIYYKPDGIGYEKVLLEWLNRARNKRNT
ncbi:MAG: hypothetical protein ACD_73C00042G0003 [uncultured bacterium]|nr:MAG: hypothetical protein ACD_73C00042G0003 [uncultured bacterium]